MKNKEIKLKIMVGILIIIIIILTIKDITKNGSIISKSEIIKEMTQTEFDNQITQLNQAHTEYADYIQSCKDEIATALKNEGVETSNDEKLETMASNISKVLKARTSDATAIADNITEGKTAYINGEKVTGTGVDVNNNKAKNLTFSVHTYAQQNIVDGANQYPIKNMDISNYSKITIGGSFSTRGSGYVRILVDGNNELTKTTNSTINLEYDISNYNTLTIHVYGSYNRVTTTDLNINLIV